MTVVRRSSVGDAADEIGAAVGEALDRTGAVITTGGLGPTADDLTKPSIAALFGRGMVLDAGILAALEARWKARFERDLPASNRQQAMLPEGARVLVNRHGSAPGVWLEDERGCWVAMLPGVPREMRGMLGDELLPLITARARAESGGAAPTVVRSRTLRTTSIAESAVADRLGPLARGAEGCSLAYLPGRDGLDLRLTVRGLPGDEADAALARATDLVRARVAEWAYGEEATDLASVVLDGCHARHFTVAVAESCTGGLLGARLTSVAGSSDVVRGGIIAYANDVKAAQLGVDPRVIATDGAVSERVAVQMAAGARARFGADVGIALTGIAGPGGGSDEKPVGTVWIGLDIAGDVHATRHVFIGDRDEIRYRAAQFALDLVRRALSSRAEPVDTASAAPAPAAPAAATSTSTVP